MGKRSRRRFIVWSVLALGGAAGACGGDDIAEPGIDAGSSSPSDASSDASTQDAGRVDSGFDAGLLCDGGTVACNGQCVPITTTTNCGSCGYGCFSAESCNTDAGTDSGLATCSGVDPLAPRPFGPLSGMLVTTRRPTFTWGALPSGFTEAHVEICSDRACDHPVADLVGTTSATPSADLPAGGLFWRTYVAAGTHHASSVTWTIFVPSVSAPATSSPKLSRDLNGDGLGDIVINSFNEQDSITDDAGIEFSHAPSYVFLGRSPLPSTTATVRLDAILAAPGYGSAYLSAPSFAGDVDGDGFADISSAVFAGGSFSWGAIYFGATSGPKSTSFSLLDKPAALPQFVSLGWGIGDVDGDGHCDFILEDSSHSVFQVAGGRGDRTDPDAGGPDFQSPLETGNYQFSWPTTSVGDLNGDGYADFVVGSSQESAPSTGGEVFVFNGSANGADLVGYSTLVGAGNFNGHFGAALDTGDIDHDGFPDVVVGAPGEAGGAGNIYVFRGGATGISVSPAWSIHGNGDAGFQGTSLGQSVAVADFNGDGYADVAATATTTAGSVVVVFDGGATGPAGAPSKTLSPPVAFSGGSFGALSAPLDATGDGYADLVAATTLSPGTAYFFTGSASGLTTPVSFTGFSGPTGTSFSWVAE